MTLNNTKMKKILLSIPPIREILFFVFQKKAYKGIVDRKISLLLNAKKKLSKTRIDNLIVSLTSFPQRIAEVKYTVYSLLDQTVLPEKIILWLAESQFPNKEQELPDDLLFFKKFGLVISWCEDLKSYKKLIPALKKFPDYYIVTADDDIYYKRKWLEKLWFEHLKYPDKLVCHFAHKIFFKNGNILPYAQWKKCIRNKKADFKTFGCSGGGVVFHKKYLFKDIDRKDLFLNLAPYADDIWFYFMVILNDTKILVVRRPHKLKYINPYREYGLNKEYRLSSVNIDESYNDQQFINILSHYNINLYSLINK